MQTVKKAIIPAAGLGTRFLPATKAQPKEMLPIVDKPTLQYIIEEAVASGIKEILIITGRNKKSIEDHFDKSVELELELEKSGKEEMLNYMMRDKIVFDVDRYEVNSFLTKTDLYGFIEYCIKNKDKILNLENFEII